VKIIAFNGSPRLEGNTEVMMNEALKPLQEAGHDITVFPLNTMDIAPCQDCGGCVETGICIYDDAMTGVFAAIREADRIILASPIFFYSISAQTKIMVDRCQAFWCEKYLLKKSIPSGPHGRKGLLLLVGGMKKDESRVTAESTVKGFFRSCSVPEHETLFFGGIDAKGDIQKHPTALKDVYAAGQRLGMK
jgi:multimeric flavodoxin WrbA